MARGIRDLYFLENVGDHVAQHVSLRRRRPQCPDWRRASLEPPEWNVRAQSGQAQVLAPAEAHFECAGGSIVAYDRGLVVQSVLSLAGRHVRGAASGQYSKRLATCQV